MIKIKSFGYTGAAPLLPDLPPARVLISDKGYDGGTFRKDLRKRKIVLVEAMTFGGSGLDRAAELRKDIQTVLTRGDKAVCVPFWRGRLLFQDDTLTALCYIPVNDLHFPLDPAAHIFIGRDEEGILVFAQTLPDWDDQMAGKAVNFDRDIYAHPDMPDKTGFAELRTAMALMAPRDAEIAATARGLFAWHEAHGFCAFCGMTSYMDMAGWQRTCDTCGRYHFPRTDSVVIMLITYGNSVLVGRSPGWPEGMYSLLAGFMEPGETVEAAVRREVVEETSIKVGKVRYLASQPWPFPSSLMLGCAGEALTTDITIDPVEIEHALWVSREEMMQAFAGDHPTLKVARKGALAHFLIQNWLADTI